MRGSPPASADVSIPSQRCDLIRTTHKLPPIQHHLSRNITCRPCRWAAYAAGMELCVYLTIIESLPGLNARGARSSWDYWLRSSKARTPKSTTVSANGSSRARVSLKLAAASLGRGPTAPGPLLALAACAASTDEMGTQTSPSASGSCDWTCQLLQTEIALQSTQCHLPTDTNVRDTDGSELFPSQ